VGYLLKTQQKNYQKLNFSVNQSVSDR
jgi:hypothetical protein